LGQIGALFPGCRGWKLLLRDASRTSRKSVAICCSL